jgi:hypothetical protein
MNLLAKYSIVKSLDDVIMRFSKIPTFRTFPAGYSLKEDFSDFSYSHCFSFKGFLFSVKSFHTFDFHLAKRMSSTDTGYYKKFITLYLWGISDFEEFYEEVGNGKLYSVIPEHVCHEELLRMSLNCIEIPSFIVSRRNKRSIFTTRTFERTLE